MNSSTMNVYERIAARKQLQREKINEYRRMKRLMTPEQKERKKETDKAYREEHQVYNKSHGIPRGKKLPEIKCMRCGRRFPPANKFIRYCGQSCRSRISEEGWTW